MYTFQYNTNIQIKTFPLTVLECKALFLIPGDTTSFSLQDIYPTVESNMGETLVEDDKFSLLGKSIIPAIALSLVLCIFSGKFKYGKHSKITVFARVE